MSELMMSGMGIIVLMTFCYAAGLLTGVLIRGRNKGIGRVRAAMSGRNRSQPPAIRKRKRLTGATMSTSREAGQAEGRSGALLSESAEYADMAADMTADMAADMTADMATDVTADMTADVTLVLQEGESLSTVLPELDLTQSVLDDSGFESNQEAFEAVSPLTSEQGTIPSSRTEFEPSQDSESMPSRLEAGRQPDAPGARHARRAISQEPRVQTGLMGDSSSVPLFRVSFKDGRHDDVRLLSGKMWTVDDTPGLAVDMHLRVTPGGVSFASVREQHHRAYVDFGMASLSLTRGEVPWQAGSIVNGDVRFSRISRPRGYPWAIQAPAHGTEIRAVASDVCVVLSKGFPELAEIAANLYVSGGVDPLGTWQRRVLAACAETWPTALEELQLVTVDSAGRVVCVGNLFNEIGLGGAVDTVPGTIYQVGGLIVREPWQQRVWLPTTDAEQRWHWDSFMITIPDAS